jgi:hypothetical protein
MIRHSSTAAGVELSLPMGDWVPSSSSRRPTIPRRRAWILGIKILLRTSAGEAKEITSAWRRILDLDLDPVRVQQHLRALRLWQLSGRTETKQNGRAAA